MLDRIMRQRLTTAMIEAVSTDRKRGEFVTSLYEREEAAAIRSIQLSLLRLTDRQHDLMNTANVKRERMGNTLAAASRVRNGHEFKL
jgi:hypothetical protein